MRTIGEAAHGRDNNFNLIRMVAASAVLVSHSWPLALGRGTAEPLGLLAGYKLGTIAVLIFFAISGFFITKSFDRRATLADFVAARVMRIYPALIVVLLLTVALLGPAFTMLRLETYAADWHSWTYLPKNLLLRRLQWALPGVFDGNAGGNAINGSLWTLFLEVSCYGMIVVAGLIGLLRTRTFPVFIAAFALWQIVARNGQWDGHANQFALLSLPFVFGMAAYVHRDRLPLSGLLAAGLWVAAVVLRQTAAWHLLFPLALAYGALWLGMVRPFRAYNRLGDYSYGMYIYAFPVQQSVAALAAPLSPWTMIAISFPITLLLAILSWRLVEAPALARRHAIVPPRFRKAASAL